MIDGNFTADHLKMKRPENDICLTPGGRYMVEPVRYENHLQEAIDYREVSFPSIGDKIHIYHALEIHML